MKKKDLGQTSTSLYDMEPMNKDSKIYPEISLPASMFDKSYKVGDKCTFELDGVIENMGKKQFRIKLTAGVEIESQAEEKKESKKESVLSGAKAK